MPTQTHAHAHARPHKNVCPHAEWLTAAASGVSAVGVGFVASATKGLLMKICVHDDKWTAIMLQLVATLAAATVIYWRAVPWLFPLTILAGALVMLAWNWKKDMSVQVGVAAEIRAARLDGHEERGGSATLLKDAAQLWFPPRQHVPT
eukprot:356841-Chlamydomonas_euryale.AAC.1